MREVGFEYAVLEYAVSRPVPRYAKKGAWNAGTVVDEAGLVSYSFERLAYQVAVGERVR